MLVHSAFAPMQKAFESAVVFDRCHIGVNYNFLGKNDDWFIILLFEDILARYSIDQNRIYKHIFRQKVV